jgi:pyridoxamine 5'-phosphate oxidase
MTVDDKTSTDADYAATIVAPAGDFATANEPFGLFETWFEEARLHEINDPHAMALATTDADGLPNCRMVLLSGLDHSDAGLHRGFVFYTNSESAKGQELLTSRKAALLFHWKSLRRQIRIRGETLPVSNAEADEYFAALSRRKRIGAWASQQSHPLKSRLALKKAVAIQAAKFSIGSIPRPPHWSGFRVVPVEIEFWHDRPFHLHERIVFRRAEPQDPWHKDRLFP